MNKKFWGNKRVLVTGFEGFLGSNLTKTLVSSEAKIFGLDKKVGRRDTILTKADYKKITVIKGNIANYALLKDVIIKNKINVVFHLAAEAIVGKCNLNPLVTFSTNIKGTWNLLEACRNSKTIKSIIIASSDKAYGTHKKLPYKEDTSLIGNHPYDMSKSCADLIAYTYFHTYNLPVAITRCGNIYGQGDFNFSRIIPDAIRCALTGKTLLIRSDGKFTRDYVYVDDIVNGYIVLAEKLQKLGFGGEAFNFSNENPITVIKLLNEIKKFNFCGNKLNYKIMNTAKYEIKKQYLSAVKAKRVLGWRPKYSLEEGLKKTMGYYIDLLSK